MSTARARGLFRIIYRRTRLYLPLLVLLLVLMAMFLPIRAGWLGTLAEREIRRQLGVEAEIGRVELTLARGTLEARNVKLIVPEEGAEPLRVERVRLEGTLTDLLAGGGGWPANVTVEGLSEARLARGPEGNYELKTPLTGVLRAREKALAEMAKEEDREPDEARLPGRLPAVLVRNFSLRVDSPSPELPEMLLAVDELRVEGRAGEGSPLLFTVRGVASARGIESFRLTGTFLPEDERLAVRGDLSGVSVPFAIPALGDFDSRVRDMRVDFMARRAGEGEFEGALEVSSRHFEISRVRLGGERWEDDSLSLRLGFRAAMEEPRLTVEHLALRGDEVNIAADGHAVLAEGLPGAARVIVSKLPSGVLALGRGELSDRLGLQVDEATEEAALRLELEAEGPLARPLEVETSVVLAASNWRLRARDIAEPLHVRDLRLHADHGVAELDRLEVELGGLTATASGRMPILEEDDGRDPGRLTVEASGTAESAFELASRLGAAPAGIRAWRGPLLAEVAAPVHARRRAGTAELNWEVGWDELQARLSWSEGELLLDRLPEPLTLDPGSLSYDGGHLEVPRAGVRVEGLQARGRAELRDWKPGMPPEEGVLVASFTASGEVPALVRLLEREIELPPEWPAGAQGRFDLEMKLDGALANPAALVEEARLRLEEGSGGVQLPHRRLEVENVMLEAVVNREEVQLRRARFRLLDEEHPASYMELQGLVTSEEARATVEGRTHLEIISVLLPDDTRDIYMRGVLPASGWVSLTPVEELPEGSTVLERWVRLLAQPDLHVAREQDRREETAALLDFELRNRQEEPVEIFPRDFPVPIRNVRADVLFTPEGFRIEQGLADIGSAEDAVVDLFVRIGIPTGVFFELEAEELDINEWLEGWGEREWAVPSHRVPSREDRPAESRLLAEIEGEIRGGRTQFLQFASEDVEGNMRVELHSGGPAPRMWLEPVRATLYGGSGEADIEFEFPSGGTPVIELTAHFEEVDVKGFMDDLLEREQAMDGLLTGRLEFAAQLLDYPTYEARGEYDITQSSMVGNVILPYARNVLQLASTTGGKDTVLRGTVEVGNERVRLPDLELINPAVNMTADGHVDFQGRLSFEVTASVISKRLQNIPVVSLVGDLINFVGNEIVTYRLRGTVEKPEYYPIPTVVARLERIRDLLRETQDRGENGASPGE